MNEMELKPNSHKYREEQQRKMEKRVKTTVSGTAKVRKKNELTKFKDVFISEDAANVKSYLWSDVFVPAAKKLITDIVKDGIEMIMYGRTTRRSSGGRDRSDYRRYYDDAGRDDRGPRVAPTRTRFDQNDILFDNLKDADDVLDEIHDIHETYGVVRVADIYDAAKLTPPWTSYDYGWTNVSSAKVEYAGNGYYYIKLPKAMAIER